MIQEVPRNWRNLAQGTPSQRAAFEIIKRSHVFEILSRFDPAHIGTIGNDIDIDGSDIDIICSATNLREIEHHLLLSPLQRSGMTVSRSSHDGSVRLVACIPTPIPIEIYAEPTPVNQQLGYRHYMTACRILKIGGAGLHSRIRELKLAGYKTEPAFAFCLGLTGDPYLALLKLENQADESLKHLLNRNVSL